MTAWVLGLPELCFGDWLAERACVAGHTAAFLELVQMGTLKDVFGEGCIVVEQRILDRVGGAVALAHMDWDVFRAIELEVLTEIADATLTRPDGKIVLYAGGRAMTDEIFSLFSDRLGLRSTACTVHVRRLGVGTEGAFTPLVERARRYSEACSYDFSIADGDVEMDRIRSELFGFLRRVKDGSISDMGLIGDDSIFGVSGDYSDSDSSDGKSSQLDDTVPLVGGTFFVSLTCTDVRDLIETGKMWVLAEGASVVELRVDLLASWDHDFVRNQTALLRRSCPLPVIYTVRTKSQGGAFPDDEDAYFALSRLAIRCGYAWVDMESHWGEEPRRSFLADVGRAAGTSVIGSHHFKDSNGGTVDDLRAQFLTCAHGGLVNIVKVVTMASTLDDALRLIEASRSLELPSLVTHGKRRVRLNHDAVGSETSEIAVIALAMGAAGTMSRILNRDFTPVSHPCMNMKAAPGQIPLKDILEARRIIQVHQVADRYFFVFGTNLERSSSSAFHNAGFKFCNLGHTCVASSTDSISEVQKVIRSKSVCFGGAGVQHPLKNKVAGLCDTLSDAAREIGAVNTIVCLQSGHIGGDNTDWLGIMKPLKQADLVASPDSKPALIVGSGNIARAALYALKKMEWPSVVIINVLCTAGPVDCTSEESGSLEADEDSREELDGSSTVQVYSGLDNPAVMATEFDVVIFASDALPTRLFLESKVLEAWQTATTHPLRSGPVFFDTTGGAIRSHRKTTNTHLTAFAAECGCKIVSSFQYSTASGWEQFRRWMGVTYESMALAAAPAMEQEMETAE